MSYVDVKKVLLVDTQNEYGELVRHANGEHDLEIKHLENPYADFSVYLWEPAEKLLYEIFPDRTRKLVKESIDELYSQTYKKPIIILNSKQVEFIKNRLADKTFFQVSKFFNSSAIDFYFMYGLISSEEYLKYTGINPDKPNEE